jgi:hypothetical protein
LKGTFQPPKLSIKYWGVTTNKLGGSMSESFMIVEEVTGYYHYHIALKDTFTKSLCNKNITMMYTAIPLSTWGYVGHLNERYCDKCKEIKESLGGNQ